MMQQDDFYTLKTAPANEPVRLVDAKNFLKIEDVDSDVLVESLIETARDDGEKLNGRSFVQRTFTGKFAGLVRTSGESLPFVQLNKAPLISVTSVKVIVDGSLVDVDSDDYYLKQTDRLSRILFINSPSVDTDIPYPLEVEFVVGYATVPARFKTAVKEHILFLYENRGDVVPDGKNTMPLVSKNIYMRDRILDTFG